MKLQSCGVFSKSSKVNVFKAFREKLFSYFCHNDMVTSAFFYPLICLSTMFFLFFKDESSVQVEK